MLDSTLSRASLTLASLTLLALPISAQIPRAEPVDPSSLPADDGSGLFERAKNLYDLANSTKDLNARNSYFQQAGDLFSSYLNDYPSTPNAESSWWYLGNSFYQVGQIDDAKRCFSTLINRYANSKWTAAAAYTLAADYYNKTQYEFAAPLFERFATSSDKPSDRPRGQFLAGNCYRLLNRDREAAILFRKVIADPNSGTYASQAKVALSQSALKDHKFAEALTLAEEILNGQDIPKVRGEAALAAAAAASKLNQPEKAAQFLQTILRTDGMEDFQADAQTALMANLYDQKSYKDVVKLFTSHTIKATGEKEAARLMIAARSYLKLNQHSKALDVFRDVEKLVAPSSDLAFEASYYRLLCFYQIEGKHVPEQVEAFISLYQKSRPNDPRIHTALMMKAESLYSDKKIPEAAKAFSQINASLLSEKNRANLLYQRAWCLADAGDNQGAIQSFSDLIKNAPKDERLASAIAKRAQLYSAIDAHDKAIEDFDHLITLGSPKNTLSFAWLESARLRRSQNQISDMIARYKGLIKNISPLTPNIESEAQYWIGWGLVKSNSPKDAIPYLEKARSLNPNAYAKHAGVLLILGYFSSQNIDKLSEEIRLAIQKNYQEEIPEKILRWTGIQAFNAGDHQLTCSCLSILAKDDDPRSTTKEVWRYLGKAKLLTGDPSGALAASKHALETEDNPAWKADTLYTIARSQFLLKNDTEARSSADAAMLLRPQGRTSAFLRILSGDLELRQNNPQKAAAEYLVVVNFHEDPDLKPLALSKLISALKAQKDSTEADKYQQILSSEFPNWKESNY